MSDTPRPTAGAFATDASGGAAAGALARARGEPLTLEQRQQVEAILGEWLMRSYGSNLRDGLNVMAETAVRALARLASAPSPAHAELVAERESLAKELAYCVDGRTVVRDFDRHRADWLLARGWSHAATALATAREAAVREFAAWLDEGLRRMETESGEPSIIMEPIEAADRFLAGRRRTSTWGGA